MKQVISKLLLSLLFCISFHSNAQSTYANPVEHMNAITKELSKVQADLWQYINAASHNKNMRKIEKRRLEIIETTKKSKDAIWKLSSYKGDATLKDAAVSYLKISHAVMTENYSKLVDMEEIAEQSYDAMEAYLMAKEMASDKLDTAGKALNIVYKEFAAKNNITLTEAENKTDEKLEMAGKVYKYYNTMYLIFFKSYKQEIYVMDALNKGDVSSLKQNGDALAKVAEEGLKTLDTIRSFNNDASLKQVCREVLTFYKNEAETKLSVFNDFLLKKGAVEKLQKSIESKSAAKRTEAEVEAYNKAIADYNDALKKFNTAVDAVNASRSKLIDKWNESSGKFTDKHVPKD